MIVLVKTYKRLLRHDKMQKKCVVCELSFEPVNKQSKYCSDECRKLAANARARKRSQEKLKNIICKQCKVVFKQTYQGNTSFCSRECKVKDGLTRRKTEGRTGEDNIKKLITASRESQGKCANCDEKDIRLFKFAHFKKEETNITVTTKRKMSEIREELKKGRWLCVWCYGIETIEEDKLIYTEVTPSSLRREKKKKYVDDIKLRIEKCAVCEVLVTPENTSCFDFEYLIPSEKNKTIKSIVQSSKSIVDEEIAKCRLLCCKCHRLHTIQRTKKRYEKLDGSENRSTEGTSAEAGGVEINNEI